MGAGGFQDSVLSLARPRSSSAAPPQRLGGVATRPAGSRIAPEQRLLQRLSFGFNQRELARIDTLGYHRYLEEQLASDGPDGEVELEVAERFPALTRSPGDLYQQFEVNPEQLVAQLVFATLYRAVFSRCQLYERMVLFWTDHFNVDIYAGDAWYLLPVQDREVVRPHALGRFEELLTAAAHSPALLGYLTNTMNRRGQINENFGRELLELHTLGLGSGYTEEDVREVARCFTGWTYRPHGTGELAGTFHFDATTHDTGNKLVLGQLVPAGGGLEDGEVVLRILAEHPATARHLAAKLTVTFWGDDPPSALVEKVALSYEASGGDVREMLRVLLRRDRLALAPPKLKRPLEHAVSLLRVLDVDSFAPFFILGAMVDGGHFPFAWPQPDGYPAASSYWSGSLLPRWRLAAGLVDESTSGARLELPFLDAGAPSSHQVASIDQLVANGTLEESTRAELRSFLEAAPPSPLRTRQALALALAAPELQEA